MSEELEKANHQQLQSSGDLIAFARSPEELQQNQAGLTAWASSKLSEAKQHMAHMEENLTQAKTFGWGVKGFQDAIRLARKQMEFYEKIHAAFKAGFYVVPDFPIDVFAVRTARVAPKREDRLVNSHWMDTDRQQKGEALPLGVGDYVSDQPVVLEDKLSIPNEKDQMETKWNFWSDSFQDVDFPIKTASVMVLDATGKAMAAKIFDEIGILPARKNKRSDPMVIGRVKFKYGSKERVVSFVIAWFLRESDLMI